MAASGSLTVNMPNTDDMVGGPRSDAADALDGGRSGSSVTDSRRRCDDPAAQHERFHTGRPRKGKCHTHAHTQREKKKKTHNRQPPNLVEHQKETLMPAAVAQRQIRNGGGDWWRRRAAPHSSRRR